MIGRWIDWPEPKREGKDWTEPEQEDGGGFWVGGGEQVSALWNGAPLSTGK